MRQRVAASLLVLFFVSGCSTFSGRAPQGETGVDGQACVGAIGPLPAQVNPAANEALLGQAQMATGKGGTCASKVVSVKAPLVLYRVFDSSKPYTKFGGWWALSRPSGPKDAYRAAYAICPEWSSLDRMVSCEVRPGTELVVGTTQSATCADGSTLPKTKEIQVFVPNDGRAGIIHVGACSEETAWP